MNNDKYKKCTRPDCENEFHGIIEGNLLENNCDLEDHEILGRICDDCLKELREWMGEK